MGIDEAWDALTDSIRHAVSRVHDDPAPRNAREDADGHQYVIRALTAVLQSSLATFDPQRPAFMPMLDAVRYVGAAGPDIDYDVAIITPGVPHRITGTRGGATYVGITVYSHAGASGASAIVASADVDELAGPDGTFTYEFEHPDAARVIIRQYFHDRATQARGTWAIERVDREAPPAVPASGALPTTEEITARLENAAQSLHWNAMLNQLWTPERRSAPNELIRQTADDIIAAIPNADVTYTFGWWQVGPGEALVIDVHPPDTRYWSLQICDRWFQCFPDRRSNLNDRQVVAGPDGAVRLVLSDGDPGAPNWLDTSGHHTGIMFFRWLHAEPATLPSCRVVPVAEVGGG